MASNTMMKVQDFIRSPFALGGYPKILIMKDGECLCAACANSNYRLISEATRDADGSGWEAYDTSIYWEGPDLYCAHCNKAIESAYGDPWADEEQS